jgi:CheY-like chemotaxis protein
MTYEGSDFGGVMPAERGFGGGLREALGPGTHTRFIPAGCRAQTCRVDRFDMAQILICESHAAVRQLLEQMVARLGHEPITASVPDARQLASADVLLVEPAAASGASIAQAASLANPSLPLICVSVAAPPAELVELGVVFTASLVQPFTSAQLAEAIERALRTREHPPGNS